MAAEGSEEARLQGGLSVVWWDEKGNFRFMLKVKPRATERVGVR